MTDRLDAMPPDSTAQVDLAGAQRDLHEIREQFAATSEVLVSLGRSATDHDALLGTLVRSARRLCGADAALIYLADGGTYRLGRSIGLSEEFVEYIDRHPLSADRQTLVGRVGLDRRTQQIADVLSDPSYGRLDTQRIAGFRTVLGAPMLFDGNVVGVLCLWRNDVHPFDERATALLTAFAAQAAMAITHVELVRTLEARTTELARKVEQLEALGAVIEAVNSSLDLDEVLSTIVMHAVQLAHADGGSIFEYDDQQEEFVVRATFGTSDQLLDALRQTPIRLTQTLVGRAAQSGRALQESDLRRGPRDVHQEQLFRAGWMSMLAVPLLREDRTVGILVVRRKSPGSYSDEIAEMLQSFADQSALAILNARVFRELGRKSQELEIASRHKSEFLANMSHELRTPLNAVIGFSEVLLERMFGDLNDRQDEYLHDILNSGKHLLELLSDVLDLSKVEAGRMELDRSTFAVREVVDDSLAQVRERAAQRMITVECDVPAEVGQLYADRRRILQVVLNLLSNAVKFTPIGGRISVRAANDADRVTISVSDTGPGIPLEDRDRIFESFQQGGRGVDRQEGTGLGLTLSRRIVELHSGRMWLDSEVGVGSTFGLALPATGTDEPTAAPIGAPANDGPVVVVVEDDPGSLELLTLYLEGAGAAVVSAGNGADGAELIRRWAPAAVVLDIQLPDIDGWELISALKNDPATAGIPVLVVSVVDERTRGLALGAAEYLVKPVSRETVRDALIRLGVVLAPSPPRGHDRPAARRIAP